MNPDPIDLTVQELLPADLEVETLADSNALGCFATATSASSLSCPSSASSFTTASSYS